MCFEEIKWLFFIRVYSPPKQFARIFLNEAFQVLSKRETIFIYPN